MTSDMGAVQRAFLPAGDPAWLSLRQEEILEPDRRIVDAHHHLWGPPRSSYLLDEFAVDLNSGHNIIATIYAECSEAYRTEGPDEFRPIGETEFAVRVASDAARSKLASTVVHAGIISRADLTLGDDIRGVLDAHKAVGEGLFKGVRFSSAWDPDPAVRSTARTPPERLLYDPQVRRGAAIIANMNLVLDCWVYHHQLGDIADLAAAVPTLSIVIDHVGGPVGIGPYAGRRDEVFAVWKRGIIEAARHPNVSVKIGGMGMSLFGFGFQNRAVPPGSEELADAWRPYFETAVEAFGPRRAMFESNFPVDQLSCSYAILWNAFKRLSDGCSEAEKDLLFRGAATRVYKLAID